MAPVQMVIAKHIHPVLKRNGFTRDKYWWRCMRGEFIFVCDLSASKHGSEQTVLTEFIGAFSCEIEQLCNLRELPGLPVDDMPAGGVLCHFGSDFRALGEDMSWELRKSTNLFLPRDEDVSMAIADVAARLDRMLPRFTGHFSSVEMIVEGLGFRGPPAHGDGSRLPLATSSSANTTRRKR